MPERITTREFQALILLELWVTSEGDPAVEVSANQLAARVESRRGKVATAWLDHALSELVKDGHAKVEFARSLLGVTTANITMSGVRWAEDNHNSHADYYDFELDKRHEEARNWSPPPAPEPPEELLESIRGSTVLASGAIVPAMSVLHTSIVELGDRRTEVAALIDSLRDLTAEVRRNNQLMAGEDAEEVERAVSEITAGTELLAADTVDKGLLERLVMKPLRWLATKAGESAWSKLVETAVEQFIDIFK